MTRVVIDPVTRVGGPLRIEADVAGGVVSDALSSATMFRGLESILVGREARSAWLLAERVCGGCTSVHALASVRAVETALELHVPRNARLIRNIIAATKFIQDHVVHFYLRQVPDWACLLTAMRADPAATATVAQSMSGWSGSSPAYFQAAKDRLAVLFESGPLAKGTWGHSAYATTPELALMLYAHYLDALDWQRQLVRVRTILGGKSPHPQTYLVGGMAVAPEWGGPRNRTEGEHPWRAARHSPPPLSAEGLEDIGRLISDAAAFVRDVFVPDVLAVAASYPDWQQIGGGIGHYLSFGEFPLDDTQPAPMLLPRGRVMDRDLSTVASVDQIGVAETVAHSWYSYGAGDNALIHPSKGETRPKYAGPPAPYATLQGYDRYSWLKAPRYQDVPMEVGPLARVLVAYARGVDDVTAGVERAAQSMERGRDGMFSTMGRIVARAIEAQVLANRAGEWVRALVANLATGDLSVIDLGGWDQTRWPAEVAGYGFVEGPGGAVGHWLSIRERRIASYQVVDANTWNASPRDARGRRGALEQALIDTPVVDAQRPLEILRTVHSFDPCMACAAH